VTEIELIQTAFDEVSPFIAERFAERHTLTISTKGHANDWLTEVDEETQRRIVKRIATHFPNDDIVGEELGMNAFPDDPAARCWLIDPIDGTQNFVRGLFPIFGVSIAFVEGERVQAGGVHLPVPNETYLATRGDGATRNGSTISVTDTASLELARVDVDLGNAPSRSRALALFPDVMERAGQVRCFCAAVIGLCSVASGDADGYFCAGLSPWDYAAAAFILEEAGGKVTRCDGSPVNLFDGRWGMLATNGALHAEGLAAIRPH
jgi:myo-inositol-1(or 4)-monophosphatase